MRHHAHSVQNAMVYPGHPQTFDLSRWETLNLSVYYGGSADVFVAQHDIVNITTSGKVNLTTGPVSTWTGTFGVDGSHGGSLTINVSSAFVNDGASYVRSGADVVVPVSVLGTGSFAVSGPARLEFAGYVADTQSVTVSGVTDRGAGTLAIDSPANFHASTTLGAPGDGLPGHIPEIDLKGLATADGYSFQNDMLSIFSGKTVIDTLRLHDATQFGFAVEKTSFGIGIIAVLEPANPQLSAGAQTFIDKLPGAIAA